MKKREANRTIKSSITLCMVILMLLQSIGVAFAAGDTQTQTTTPKQSGESDTYDYDGPLPSGMYYSGDVYETEDGFYYRLITEATDDEIIEEQWVDGEGNPVDDPNAEKLTYSSNKRAKLPTKYDVRDEGINLPVKNQRGDGHCWAYAATAALENNAVKKGIISNENPLSAYHAALYAKWGYIAGEDDDGNDGPDGNIGGSSGFIQYVADSFRRMSGAAFESRFPHASDEDDTNTHDNDIKKTYALRRITDVTLENYYYIDEDSKDTIKQAVMEYGGVAINFNRGDKKYNGYFYDSYLFKIPTHYVVIVGWDDSISKSKFPHRTPKHDGAWLCKNSWGGSSGRNDYSDSGYFWMSYDQYITEAMVFDSGDAIDIDKSYVYDGAGSSLIVKGADEIANVFTAEENGYITRVSFSGKAGKEYKIKIYKNIKSDYNKPTDGTLVYKRLVTQGKTPFIFIEDDIEVRKGEIFSVVVIGDSLRAESQNWNSATGEIKEINCKYTYNHKKSYVYNDNKWKDILDYGSIHKYGNTAVRAFTAKVKNDDSAKVHFIDCNGNVISKVYGYDIPSTTLINEETGYPYACFIGDKEFNSTSVKHNTIVTVHNVNPNGEQVNVCTTRWVCDDCGKTVREVSTHKYNVTPHTGSVGISVGYGNDYYIFSCIYCKDRYYDYQSLSGEYSNLKWNYGYGTLTIECIDPNKETVIPDCWEKDTDEIPWYYGQRVKNLIIGEGITEIGSCAFSNLKNLQSVSFPQSLKKIGIKAFSNTALKSIIIPANVEEICKYAFLECSSLELAQINGKPKLGNAVFKACVALRKVSFTYAFRDVEVDFGRVFYDCARLTQLELPGHNLYISTYHGVFSKDMKTMYFYYSGNVNAYFKIPDEVEKLEYLALCKANNLLYLDLGNITQMDKYSIYYCDNLKGINVSTNLSMISINMAINESTTEKMPIYLSNISDAKLININEINNRIILYTPYWCNEISNLEKLRCKTVFVHKTHSYTANTYTQYGSTCVSASCTIKSCVCGRFIYEETNPKNSTIHTGQTYLMNFKAPTCGESGFGGNYYCTGCYELLQQGAELPPTGKHEYSATPVSNGDGTHSKCCINCGAKETTPQACSGGKATCKELAKCTVCNGYYGEYSLHKMGTFTNNNDATCLKDATATATCSVCGNTTSKVLSNTKLDHNFSGAYLSNGNGTHSRLCIKCKVVYGNAQNCSSSVTSCKTRSVCDYCKQPYGNIGHDFEGRLINNMDATCLKNGTVTGYCKKCKTNVTITNYGSKLSHSYTGEAMYNDNGTHSLKCVNGCERYGLPIKCSAAPRTIATCISGKICTVCNAEYTARKAHTFGTYSLSANATCQSDEKQVATCKFPGCNATDVKLTPNTKLNHNYNGKIVSNGNSTHSKICTNGCGLPGGTASKCSGGTATCTTTAECQYCKSDYGKLAPHTLGAYVSNNDNTCTYTGTESAKCSVCNVSITRTASDGALKAHSFTNYVSDGNSTCTNPGTKTAKCDNPDCNKTNTIQGTTTAHKPKKNPGTYCLRTPADCCTAASYYYVCEVCSKTIEGDYYYLGALDMSNHKHINEYGKCDDCGTQVQQTSSCDCKCHQGGFNGFLWKIARLFYKIFGTNRTCKCGASHY